MSIFRKALQPKIVSSQHEELLSVVVKETLENGTVVETLKLVTPEEFESMHNLPKEEDYKLKDLLAAGVDLKEISTAGLLDSSDFFDQSVKINNLSSSMLDKLHEFEAKRDTSTDNDNKSDKPAE